MTGSALTRRTFAVAATGEHAKARGVVEARGGGAEISSDSGVLPGGLRYLSATGAGKAPVVHTRSKENRGGRGGAEILWFSGCVCPVCGHL